MSAHLLLLRTKRTPPMRLTIGNVIETPAVVMRDNIPGVRASPVRLTHTIPGQTAIDHSNCASNWGTKVSNRKNHEATYHT